MVPYAGTRLAIARLLAFSIAATPPRHTILLLSPAKLGGERAALVFNPRAQFPLARRLRSGGAPLGELFSFVSSLYFRGKVAYQAAFGRPPPGTTRRGPRPARLTPRAAR